MENFNWAEAIRWLILAKGRSLPIQECADMGKVWCEIIGEVDLPTLKEAFRLVSRAPEKWPDASDMLNAIRCVNEYNEEKRKSIEYYGCDVDQFPKCYWEEIKKVEYWGDLERYELYGKGELKEATYLAWKNHELFIGKPGDDFKAIAKYEKNLEVKNG
jgi:hypothetical protein